MADVFDSKPAPAVERLARIEGQSNFLSLLAGIEAGPDTTEDMAALAFSRGRGAIPEALEAHVAQSTLFKAPLMSLLFEVIQRDWEPPKKDYPWIQGAIADAFLLLQRGECKASAYRSRRFKVGKAPYLAMRNLAHGVFSEMIANAERAWYASRNQ
jgi:hypothetical protein